MSLCALATVALAVPAEGGLGDLSFVDCITGELDSGPVGSGACAPIPSATADGVGAGINRPQSVALSSDGKSLYAASDEGDAITHFKRNRDTGALSYRGCITSATESGPAGTGACTAIPSASADGVNSGLDDPDAVAVSHDGRSVYAAADADAAVAIFKRDRRTGTLSYQGCVTGNTDTGPAGSGACAATPGATPSGTDSGLAGLEAIALSADDRSLYVTGQSDAAVVHFHRNRKSGGLAYRGCISGDAGSGPAGTGACAAIPDATANGDNSGLFSAGSVALSPSGDSLYVTARGDASMARFKRDPTSGALAYRGCISGEAESGPGGIGGTAACLAIPEVSSGGMQSGLSAPDTVIVSGDGESVYVSSAGDDAVGHFDRAPRSGRLSYRGCITGDLESGPGGGGGSGACAAIPGATMFGFDSGLDDLDAIALSPDDRSLYAVSEDGAGLAHLKRNRRTGGLAYRGCISGDDETGPLGTNACALAPAASPGGSESGFDDPESVAVAENSVYLVSEDDDAVIRLRRKRR